MAKIDPILAESIHRSLVDFIKENYERYYYLAYSLVKNKEGAAKIVTNTVYFSLYNGRKLKDLPPMHVWFLQLVIRDGMRTMNNKTYPRDFTDDSQLYAYLETLEPSAVNVFRLYYFEGLNKEKTGDVLGMNAEEVQRRLDFVMSKMQIDSSMDEESQMRLTELMEKYEAVTIPGDLGEEIDRTIKREEDNFKEFLEKHKRDKIRKPIGLLIFATIFFFGTILLGRSNQIFAESVLSMPIVSKLFAPFF